MASSLLSLSSSLCMSCSKAIFLTLLSRRLHAFLRSWWNSISSGQLMNPETNLIREQSSVSGRCVTQRDRKHEGVREQERLQHAFQCSQKPHWATVNQTGWRSYQGLSRTRGRDDEKYVKNESAESWVIKNGVRRTNASCVFTRKEILLQRRPEQPWD